MVPRHRETTNAQGILKIQSLVTACQEGQRSTADRGILVRRNRK